jgi:hypothetical protein
MGDGHPGCPQAGRIPALKAAVEPHTRMPRHRQGTRLKSMLPQSLSGDPPFYQGQGHPYIGVLGKHLN